MNENTLIKNSNITTGTFNAVYAEDGFFIAIGSSGIKYSDDGITWNNTNITSLDATKKMKIAYDGGVNGYYIAIIEGSGIKYSDDGERWHNSEITTGDYTVDVLYNPEFEQFLVIGTSDIIVGDGDSWTSTGILSQGEEIIFGSCSQDYLSGRTVISCVSKKAGSYYNHNMYSDDLDTWDSCTFEYGTFSYKDKYIVYNAFQFS